MKDDIRAHLRKAHERLEEARILLEKGRPAGTVNRTYYAMFEAACAMLADSDIKVESHEGAKIKFGELFVKTNHVEPRFGRDLSNALELRKDVDYAIDARSEISLTIAREEFQKATEFVAMAEAFLKVGEA